MAAPNRKRVTDEVFERIGEAITLIAADTAAPRTKREIERLSGLAHDTVARAFKQDQLEETPWKITARFLATGDASTHGRSPEQQRLHDAQQVIEELKHKNRDLESALNSYAATLLAYHLNVSEQNASDGPFSGAVPMIGRNRRGRGNHR
jgi:hypothetical protein